MIRREQLPDHTDKFEQKLFKKSNLEQYDPKRVKRMQMAEINPTSQADNAKQVRQELQMHKFRDDIRKRHRELAQQQHEQMKLVEGLTKSALDKQKFKINPEYKARKKHIVDDTNKNRSNNFQKPCINLKLDTELSSNLVPQKFQIENIYNILPFKKQSIEVSPIDVCDPKFQFYILQQNPKQSRDLIEKLYNISEEGLPSDFRNQLTRITYHQNFYDYLNFIQDSYLHVVGGSLVPYIKQKTSKYPQVVTHLSKHSMDSGQNSDDDEINRNQLKCEQKQTFHRIFVCAERELTPPEESIYFTDPEDYANYKKLRGIQFLSLKIYDKDITLNTQVHKIIFSQKIYLINIQDQIQLLIELSQTNKEEYLMRKIHSDMIEKIGEYLRLICGYTRSTITNKYNIPDPYTKIYEFISKSILYNKPYIYEQVPSEVLVKYPVLQIWYDLPEKLHGYDRSQIHNSLYKLIKTALIYEKKIKYLQDYQDLKKKRYNRKYDATEQKQRIDYRKDIRKK